MSDNPGILAGVRVLDFSRMLSGSYCTVMLADHGAEVIKIERRGGETSRSNCESPYVKWPSYDVVAQAMGGLMSITGPVASTPMKAGRRENATLVNDIVKGWTRRFSKTPPPRFRTAPVLGADNERYLNCEPRSYRA